MIRQVKGLLYFYWTDLQFSLLVFWSILLSMLVMTISIMYIFPTIGYMSFSLTTPIYFYCGIIGFLMARQTVPYSIKLGATRKNIYLSMGIFFVCLTATKSILAALITEFVEKLVIRERMSFEFVHLMIFHDNTFLNRVYSDFLLLLFLTTFMYLISLMFYRMGLLYGGFVSGVVIVFLMYMIFAGDMLQYIVKTFTENVYVFFAQFGGLALIAYVLSWFFLRRITVIAKK